MIPVPGTAAIRDDVDVPVLIVETESDLTFLGYFAARQDDSENVRLWEVAGTAHADSYLTVAGRTDRGRSPDGRRAGGVGIAGAGGHRLRVPDQRRARSTSW